MKFAKPLLVVGLMFVVGSIASSGCTTGDGGGAGGDSGGSGGDSGGSGGAEAGKGGSATGGKGGGGGNAGSASGGSGGSASGGGGGSSVGGNSGGGGASGGMNAAGAGGMNTGGGAGAGTGGSGGTVAVAGKFKTDIVPILTAKCGNACHGGQYVSRPYARLMENTNPSCGGGKRVVPSSAATSPVIKKVKGTADACGMKKMPYVRPPGCNSSACEIACAGDQCLTPDQIAKLESWINAGANDD